MRTASLNEIVALLTRLKLETKSRAEDGGDMQGQLESYARRIAEYPEDVVRHVLETQSAIEKFWPAWAELKERLDLKSGYRRKLLHALQNAPKAPVKPTAPPVDPEMHAKAQAILAERARKRAPISEPTPEEFAKMKADALAHCESA